MRCKCGQGQAACLKKVLPAKGLIIEAPIPQAHSTHQEEHDGSRPIGAQYGRLAQALLWSVVCTMPIMVEESHTSMRYAVRHWTWFRLPYHMTVC
mmetsp:Transcript_35753/g.71152  ORF Transcript_35753/g.71152 Transcript_35753/m.71152 type:complete len:95 (-) Transcript_35753:632-916(-)